MQIQKTFRDQIPTLFLITSPIGNLQTISHAVKPLLLQLNYLFCEDTRITQKLLNHLQLTHLKLFSFHKFNEHRRQIQVLELLNTNHNVGLISCAGVPLIADPGYKLVNAVLAQKFAVTSIGLNNSGLAALIVSGLPTQTFFFVNFLARKPLQKERFLTKLSSLSTTFVFFESVHRIKATLQLMQTIWPQHRFALARELTKKHETIYRGQLSMLKLKTITLKGEFVLVIDHNLPKSQHQLIHLNQFEAAIANLNLTSQQTIKLARRLFKLPRKLLKISND